MVSNSKKHVIDQQPMQTYWHHVAINVAHAQFTQIDIEIDAN